MSAATFTDAARNAYLDTLTGKAVSNAYKLAASTLYLLDAADSILISSFVLPSTWPVTAGTATHTQAAIPVDCSGTIAKVTDASQQIISGAATLTGGGGAVVVSALNVTLGGTLGSATCTFKIPLNNGGTLRINQALASAWANSILNNTGHPAMANGGTLDIYTGPQPATADTEPTGATKLWTATLATTNFNAAAAGAVSMAAAKAANAIATGTAAWARWTKGALVMDGTVGTTGADFIVTSVSMTSGSSYSVTGMTLSFPA